MNVAWVMYALLVGALLMLAANALAGAAGRLGLPTRFAWAGAMVALVALSLSAPLRSAPTPNTVGGVRVVAGRSLATATPSLTLAQRFAIARGKLSVAEQSAAAAVTRLLPPGTRAVFPLVWITATALVAALMLLVTVTTARQLATWPRTELHGARIRLTHDIGPAVVGFTSPEIVIPGWLLARSDEEQRLALAHEREHVLARDHWLLAGGWLVVALLPWHPAAWWMLNRLRLAMELDCDARVLRAGVATRSYGKMLIDIADHCSGQRALTLALADHTSHLERRLLAMKNPRARYGRTRATMLAATGALAVLVACESKMPTSAEIDNSNVAALEKKAVDVALLSKAAPTEYVVNGKAASAAEAHVLSAKQIASVQFHKAVKIDGGNRVVITTTDSAGRALSPVRSDTVAVSIGAKKEFDGIYVIDGVQASAKDFIALKLDPNRIESIEIVKGAAAARLYSDPAAANGVISITTKK